MTKGVSHTERERERERLRKERLPIASSRRSMVRSQLSTKTTNQSVEHKPTTKWIILITDPGAWLLPGAHQIHMLQ